LCSYEREYLCDVFNGRIFPDFFRKAVPNGDTTQVLVAISLETREEVDQVVNAAVANGATQHEEPQDYGWMYHNSFGTSTDMAGM
jgi:predicted lactoylglutathione lyase